jgi:hypothetical protein
VAWLAAEASIRQFLDIGTGVPGRRRPQAVAAEGAEQLLRAVRGEVAPERAARPASSVMSRMPIVSRVFFVMLVRPPHTGDHVVTVT